MSPLSNPARPNNPQLPKTPTGINGLDEVTGGGLPAGRTTLVCGGPGCGKTLFAMEFLVRGAIEYGEPGVFLAFEETPQELAANVRSLGFDLDELIERKLLVIDYIRVERSEIEETGEYDLEGLFVRLGYAIDSIGAKRVVLDTIEILFTGLNDDGILRSELRRLFKWLKDKDVTAIVTGERGDGSLTRHGLEEYISDCVILLDHRVNDQVSTRRLRVVKYRGTFHGTNEFPFLIDQNGISVIPITSAGMDHPAFIDRVSSGIPALDDMLGGEGYFRGSSILVTGTAGTGKTSIAAQFAAANCARGERCLYCSFEESPAQLTRNMRSIGLDLAQWQEQGLLRIHAARPTLQGLERHLAEIHRMIDTFRPTSVIIDPVSTFTATGTLTDSSAMVIVLVDYMKSKAITTLCTSLTPGSKTSLETELGITSLIDTWLLLQDLEVDGERSVALYVLKSRGMAHSHRMRSLWISNDGINLGDFRGTAESRLIESLNGSEVARP